MRAVSVVSVPHARWGQRPVAFVEAEPGQIVDTVEIDRMCEAELAAYKRPDLIHVIEALPRLGATDKVDRAALRALGRALTDTHAADDGRAPGGSR